MEKKRDTHFYKNLFFSCLLCMGGGWISGLITSQSIDTWYKHLILPPGTPPNLIFPIVWTILYFLMAISFSLVLSSPIKNKQGSIKIFLFQLFLNLNWSWLFFGLKAPLLALVDLTLLWVFIIATIVSFKKHSFWSAVLLVPYLLWVTYAFYLNLFIWLKN